MSSLLIYLLLSKDVYAFCPFSLPPAALLSVWLTDCFHLLTAHNYSTLTHWWLPLLLTAATDVDVDRDVVEGRGEQRHFFICRTAFHVTPSLSYNRRMKSCFLMILSLKKNIYISVSEKIWFMPLSGKSVSSQRQRNVAPPFTLTRNYNDSSSLLKSSGCTNSFNFPLGSILE